MRTIKLFYVDTEYGVLKISTDRDAASEFLDKARNSQRKTVRNGSIEEKDVMRKDWEKGLVTVNNIKMYKL